MSFAYGKSIMTEGTTESARRPAGQIIFASKIEESRDTAPMRDRVGNFDIDSQLSKPNLTV